MLFRSDEAPGRDARQDIAIVEIVDGPKLDESASTESESLN